MVRLVPDYDKLVDVSKISIVVRLYDKDVSFIDREFLCSIHLDDNILLFDSFVAFIHENFDIQSVVVGYPLKDTVVYMVSVYV